jgi:hypothetical protein
MAFFPGASALRAMAADVAGAPGLAVWPDASLPDEWQAVAQRVSACPWTGLHPLVVKNAVPLRTGDRMLAVADGRALVMVLGDADTWKLLACSGGRPLQLMGEWDGHVLKPLTAWQGGDASFVWQRGAA